MITQNCGVKMATQWLETGDENRENRGQTTVLANYY
jgi:hypothetical protein